MAPGRADPFPRPDVQAALTVIGRRDGSRDRQDIDLTGAILPRALLFGADLTGVRLVDSDPSHAVAHSGTKLAGADLRNADLTGADLTGADLAGANPAGATLTDAKLNRANLSGARWPQDVPVPHGWELDTGSGQLTARGTDAGPV